VISRKLKIFQLTIEHLKYSFFLVYKRERAYNIILYMETNNCFIETMTKVQMMLHIIAYMKEFVWQKTNKGVEYIRTCH